MYIPFQQLAIGAATVALRIEGDGDPLALLSVARDRTRAVDPAVRADMFPALPCR